MIFYDFRQGLTQKQCYDRMKSTFGSEASSKAMINNWFKEFSLGHKNLSDDVWEGWPRSAVIAKLIDAMKKLITSDHHVHWISHDHIKVKKACSQWISYNLSEVEKDTQVEWCQKNLNKFNTGALKHVYDIVSTTKSGAIPKNPKQNNSRLFESSIWP